MSMTVKQMIAALRRMPPGARVVFCAHDQDADAGEYDGFVNEVTEASPAMMQHGAGVVIR